MKKSMKWISVCLAAVLLLAALPVMGLSAAGQPAFVVDEVSGNPGDTVSVKISTRDNPGIVGLRLKVSYDAAVLELTKTETGAFKGITFGPLDKNPFTFSWVDAIHPNNTTNGTVATLTFTVKNGAPAGKSAITLSYDAADVFGLGANSGDFVDVAFATVAGGVTVGGSGGSGGAPSTNKVLHSVTELDDAYRGLGFLFSVPAKGVKKTATSAPVLSGATVSYRGTDCPLVRMGALLTANATLGGNTDGMVRGAAGVTDVAVTALWDTSSTACSYAVRMMNIPASAVGRTVYARAYYVVQYQGAEVVVYGDIDATTYQANR